MRPCKVWLNCRDCPFPPRWNIYLSTVILNQGLLHSMLNSQTLLKYFHLLPDVENEMHMCIHHYKYNQSKSHSLPSCKWYTVCLYAYLQDRPLPINTGSFDTFSICSSIGWTFPKRFDSWNGTVRVGFCDDRKPYLPIRIWFTRWNSESRILWWKNHLECLCFLSLFQAMSPNELCTGSARCDSKLKWCLWMKFSSDVVSVLGFLI